MGCCESAPGAAGQVAATKAKGAATQQAKKAVEDTAGKTAVKAAENLTQPQTGAGKPDNTAARAAVEQKMKAALEKKELSQACIDAFLQQYDALVRGETGMISESAITPVDSLPHIDELNPATDAEETKKMLEKTVILKLNGGLGTGMGLDKAKSLLVVKEGQNFLDFTAKQVKWTRSEEGVDIALVLMNSFSTEADTKAALAGHNLGDWDKINMVQNKVPKILIDNNMPADLAGNDWCPPGHGDLYAALLGSGKLDQLIKDGKEYVFVSNSDNLGATLNLSLLQHFAKNDFTFMMEVARRTEADKKGGHLARKGDGLILRESAQCPKEDEGEFQNIGKYKFFNTNNLWFKLSAAKKVMDDNGGVMKLPMIRNKKTVDPKDKSTPECYQLETAMGAAIETFGSKATAVVINRDRFAPVKKCDDLISLRSDAYEVDADCSIKLSKQRPMEGVPPTVSLSDTYKMMPAFDKLTQSGATNPSMLKCTKLTITKDSKPFVFGPGVVLEGEITIECAKEGATLEAGTYTDKTIKLRETGVDILRSLANEGAKKGLSDLKASQN